MVESEVVVESFAYKVGLTYATTAIKGYKHRFFFVDGL